MISSLNIDFSLLAPAASTLNAMGYFQLPQGATFEPVSVSIETPAPDNSKSLSRKTSIRPDMSGGFYAPGENNIGLSVTAHLTNGTVSFSAQARQSGDGTLNALLMDGYLQTKFTKFGYDNKSHGPLSPKFVALPVTIVFTNKDGSKIVAADEILKTAYTCTPNIIGHVKYQKA